MRHRIQHFEREREREREREVNAHLIHFIFSFFISRNMEMMYIKINKAIISYTALKKTKYETLKHK